MIQGVLLVSLVPPCFRSCLHSASPSARTSTSRTRWSRSRSKSTQSFSTCANSSCCFASAGTSCSCVSTDFLILVSRLNRNMLNHAQLDVHDQSTCNVLIPAAFVSQRIVALGNASFSKQLTHVLFKPFRPRSALH